MIIYTIKILNHDNGHIMTYRICHGGFIHSKEDAEQYQLAELQKYSIADYSIINI